MALLNWFLDLIRRDTGGTLVPPPPVPAHLFRLQVLHAVAPALSGQQLIDLRDVLEPAMREFEIDTAPRVAAFLAQLAHESAGFQRLEEMWGPTLDQVRYDRAGNTLGNRTNIGEGYRYRGRGYIQLTGRWNYTAASDALFGDERLVREPELAAEPMIAARVAAWYWRERGCNALADVGAFEAITRAINGPGMYGLSDRAERWRAAQAAIAIDAEEHAA